MIFKTCFNGEIEKSIDEFKQDLSNKFEKAYIEIPPFTANKETGEILNPESFPILKETTPINVYDKIQSYAKECDLYDILTRIAQSGGEIADISSKTGFYGDYSNVPDNINDQHEYFAEKQSQAQSMGLDNESLNNPDTITQLVLAQLIKEGYVKTDPINSDTIINNSQEEK